MPRSGSEQQLPRAETHSDFGRHSLLRSSLKASAATGGNGSKIITKYLIFYNSYSNLMMYTIFQRQV